LFFPEPANGFLTGPVFIDVFCRKKYNRYKKQQINRDGVFYSLKEDAEGWIIPAGVC
jgi:hypothetical protein